MAKKQAMDDPCPVGEVVGLFRRLGWVVPSDESDVRRAERGSIQLPPGLGDAGAVFDGRGAWPPRSGVKFPSDAAADADAALARAAREGKAIPSSIEEAMRRDRQAAENQGDRT